MEPNNSTVNTTVVTERSDFMSYHFQSFDILLILVFFAVDSGRTKLQIVFVIEKLKFPSLKIELEKVLIQPNDSIVEVGGITVDDEMIGKEGVDFHEPIRIKGDTFSDFAGG